MILVHAFRTKTKLVNEGFRSIIEMIIHRSTNIWSIRSLIVTSRHLIPKLDDKKSRSAGIEIKIKLIDCFMISDEAIAERLQGDSYRDSSAACFPSSPAD